MPERFFRAAALAGELHFIDLSDWDDWDSGKVQYRDDTEVSWLMRTGAGERRVIRTVAELDAAIVESAAPRGIYLYPAGASSSRRRTSGRRAILTTGCGLEHWAIPPRSGPSWSGRLRRVLLHGFSRSSSCRRVSHPGIWRLS